MGQQAEKAVDPEGGIGRREFMQGAAATGIVVVGSGYVKPALKLAGVTRLASTASAPPVRVRPKEKKKPDDEHENTDNNRDDQKASRND